MWRQHYGADPFENITQQIDDLCKKDSCAALWFLRDSPMEETKTEQIMELCPSTHARTSIPRPKVESNRIQTNKKVRKHLIFKSLHSFCAKFLVSWARALKTRQVFLEDELSQLLIINGYFLQNEHDYPSFIRVFLKLSYYPFYISRI